METVQRSLSSLMKMEKSGTGLGFMLQGITHNSHFNLRVLQNFQSRVGRGSSTIAGRSEPSRLSVGRLSDQSQRLPAGHGAAHCRQTAPITPVTHCPKLPTLHEVFFSLAFSDVPQPPTHGLAKCLHKVKWSPTAVSCQLYDRFFRLFLLLSPLTLISPKVGLIDTNNCLFQALPYVL